VSLRAVALSVALTLCAGIAWSADGQVEPEPVTPVERSVRQLVVVKAKTWTSTTGSLQRYQRDARTPAWTPVGELVTVNLGRRGLAWGRGLHEPPKAGPVKREGDGRSPAGVFELERAFGEAEGLPPDSRGFPYLPALETSYCVEDVRSPYYNRLIDSTQTKPSSWQRWSPLRRADGLFRWGVVVRQNSPDTVVGAGSCVFLHVWRGPRQPTSGCTAMRLEDIEAVIRWLDPEAHPTLVQLPETEYQRLKETWALP
jgi:L,D-peptidoglycan transpeptidase YkuD (ErfK/YbiS/YcfS/YnhG family)